MKYNNIGLINITSFENFSVQEKYSLENPYIKGYFSTQENIPPYTITELGKTTGTSCRRCIGGCLASNGNIYGVTEGIRKFTKIIPSTNAVSYLNTPVNATDGLYESDRSVLANNGKIYLVSNHWNTKPGIYCFDPLTEKVALTLSSANIPSNAFSDIRSTKTVCACKNGNIYFARSNKMHIYNTEDNTIRSITLIEDYSYMSDYCASIEHPNGLLYFFPNSSENNIVIFNPETESLVNIVISPQKWTSVTLNPIDGNLISNIFTDNSKYYMVFDVKTNKIIEYNQSHPWPEYGNTLISPNKKVYSMVTDVLSGTLWEYTLDEMFNSEVKPIGVKHTTAYSPPSGYYGALFSTIIMHPDGFLYYLPRFANAILKIDLHCKMEDTTLYNASWLKNLICIKRT